jgi:uncharacterized protein (DUF1810 family)
MTSDPFRLARFLEAQARVYAQVRAELAHGVFGAALARYFAGEPDPLTVRLLTA